MIGGACSPLVMEMRRHSTTLMPRHGDIHPRSYCHRNQAQLDTCHAAGGKTPPRRFTHHNSSWKTVFLPSKFACLFYFLVSCHSLNSAFSGVLSFFFIPFLTLSLLISSRLGLSLGLVSCDALLQWPLGSRT